MLRDAWRRGRHTGEQGLGLHSGGPVRDLSSFLGSLRMESQPLACL